MGKLSRKIAQKSLDAALAALEIYNKPIFNYRDETFCILMINAYELLFKARIIEINDENIKSIYVCEKRRNKNGTLSKKEYIKRNRIGEPFTIELKCCTNILNERKEISNNIVENLNIMTEIRDNAIHLFNNSIKSIKAKVYQICAANVRNYAKLLEKWFPKIKLDMYNFFITPLNFSDINRELETVNLNVAQKNFLNYIELVNFLSEKNDEHDEYDILIKIDVKFVKSEVNESVLLKYVQEGKKVNIEFTEETFKK